MRRGIKGQSIFEYAMIITIVVASLVTMRIYMKRAIEGRVRGSMDEIGELYSPLCVTSKFTTEQKDDIVEMELFGVDAAGAPELGASTTVVLGASEIVRSATGATDMEKVYMDLKTTSYLINSFIKI